MDLDPKKSDPLKNPMDLPPEFKSWLVKWLEVNPPSLPVAQMLGYKPSDLPLAKLSLAGTTAILTGGTQPLQLAASYDSRLDSLIFPDRGAANSAFTVKKTGYYIAQACLTYPSNATGVRWTQLFKNGSAIGAGDGGPVNDLRSSVATPSTPEVTLAGTIHLAANDFVQLVGFQNSGVSLTPTVGWVTLIKIA